MNTIVALPNGRDDFFLSFFLSSLPGVKDFHIHFFPMNIIIAPSDVHLSGISMWHDSFIWRDKTQFVAWLCDFSDIYEHNYSAPHRLGYNCVIWLIYSRNMTQFTRVTRLNLWYDSVPSLTFANMIVAPSIFWVISVWHDSFIRVTRLNLWHESVFFLKT